MTVIRLHPKQRKKLEQVARTSPSGREVRRAQALLWLDQGETIQQVAERLGISRQALYDLLERYQSRKAEPVVLRIQDRPHPGRPADKRERVVQAVQELLAHKPQEYGYRSPFWTVPMLVVQVTTHIGEEVSHDTIRRALRVLRHRYKRPRYVLSRRSPTWRQAKGGLNVASRVENVL
jgi:transposase